jgi:hypothetical protein
MEYGNSLAGGRAMSTPDSDAWMTGHFSAHSDRLMWRLIAPRIARRFWRDLLLSTAVGAASAGLFGVLHDQVTYMVSEEYFTKVKFVQFAYADPGTGPRAFAGVVGFLASWWVGAIAGWLLGRLAFPRLARREAWRRVAQGYGWVFGGALTGALAGAVIGHRVASSPALET